MSAPQYADPEKHDAVRVQDGVPPAEPTASATGNTVDMYAYRQSVPLWRRVWQHSLTQMLLLSVQATCGPAMADAIAGLGGGGLATPQTSNIATALTYTFLALVCFFGGPLVNKIGVKWALVIGAMSFPIEGSAYYCNSKFGNQWYLILSGAISGIGTGCWYVAEAGSIMSLSPSGARGKYLALWIVSRNLGQLVGGAIKYVFQQIMMK
jgi:MFS family permease